MIDARNNHRDRERDCTDDHYEQVIEDCNRHTRMQPSVNLARSANLPEWLYNCLCLLSLIEHWFNKFATCVRFGGYLSDYFQLKCGVRQGKVISPYFFAVYIDDLIRRLQRLNCGCFIRSACVNAFLYADYIILLVPSIDALTKILRTVENELATLDMALNASK